MGVSMDAVANLREVIQRERGIFSPETNSQLLGGALAVGAGVGLLIGLITAGSTIGTFSVMARRGSNAVLTATTATRLSAITGGVAGSCAAIPTIAAVLINGKSPIEENAEVREAAIQVAIRGKDADGNDEIQQIVNKALATVTPERLSQDVAFAVRNESASILRKGRTVRSLVYGATSGGIAGYATFSAVLGFCVATRLNPMGAIKAGGLVGGGIGAFGALAGFCHQPGPVEQAPSVVEAQRRLALRVPQQTS